MLNKKKIHIEVRQLWGLFKSLPWKWV